MSYDYYASIDTPKTCPEKVSEFGIASGFVDECTVWSCQNKPQNQKADPKNEARQCYMKLASELNNLSIPEDCVSDPDFSCLPDSSWIGIKVVFTLKTPWYSKDDRPFHVLDNPVRKDRVFGVPFMSAASWKGMLRWACRMQSGLADHLKTHNMRIDDWKDPEWILHLFGNEQGETESDKFKAGALVFYPTWFKQVGFEVINPHSRKTKAGTKPIFYEVVPANTKGCLHLLYASLPGQAERDKINPGEMVEKFIDGIEQLLQTYGISAKRTVGWGTAHINNWRGFVKPKNEGVRSEDKPIKKTLKSFQELASLKTKPVCKDSFVSEKSEDFKKQIKERLALKGDGR